MNFVIKIDRLGGKAEVRGLAVGDERIARAEIPVRDFVSNAALPVRITLVGGSNQEQERRRRRSRRGRGRATREADPASLPAVVFLTRAGVGAGVLAIKVRRVAAQPMPK